MPPCFSVPLSYAFCRSWNGSKGKGAGQPLLQTISMSGRLLQQPSMSKYHTAPGYPTWKGFAHPPSHPPRRKPLSRAMEHPSGAPLCPHRRPPRACGGSQQRHPHWHTPLGRAMVHPLRRTHSAGLWCHREGNGPGISNPERGFRADASLCPSRGQISLGGRSRFQGRRLLETKTRTIQHPNLRHSVSLGRY